ncbi:MAG: DHHW family protein [Cellulosilyticaceae bacterium]
MKKINRHKVVSIIFLSIIFVIGSLTAILRVGAIGESTLKGLQKVDHEQASSTDYVKGMIEGFETGVNSNIIKKEYFVNIYGLVQRILGVKVIGDTNPNSTVALDNKGNLTFVCGKQDVVKYVNQMVQFRDDLSKSNIPLVYVQAPFKMFPNNNELPVGIEDYSNDNADDFLLELKNNDIPYIDIRECIEEDGLNKDELFYKTDHHWKTETAFYAYMKVAERLIDDFNLNISKPNINRDMYNITTYEDCFLGSQGRKVGKYYVGVDDYTLITPNYDTSYEVEYSSNKEKVVLEGTFEHTLIKPKFLDMDRPVETDRNAAYQGGNRPEVIINNKDNTEGKLLIIQDSFGVPFSSFMSLSVAEVRTLDIRRYLEKSLKEYIQDYSPDAVLFLYSPVSYENDVMFEFGY